MTGAEMPSNSDLIKWAEQGRLHIKYNDVEVSTGGAGDDQITITVNDALIPTNQVFNPGDASEIALRIEILL